MDLKYLTTFRTIVETGSFSKAAERLNYTQSTITFQMGQLEQELEAKLFEKVGKRMVLTKAGESLLPYVEEVLCAVEKLRYFEQDLAQCRGKLTVGVAETLLCYKLPPLLKEFHRRAPQAQLMLCSMSCFDIRDELLRGSLDLGLFYQDVGGFGGNLTIYPIGTYPAALACAPGGEGTRWDFRTPQKQIPTPFVRTAPDCVFRQMFEGYLQAQSIQMEYNIELRSIPTIKNLVKNEVGVCFLPRFALAEELERGELVELPTAMDNPVFSAVCAHHKNKWISPLLQLFLDLVTPPGAL